MVSRVFEGYAAPALFLAKNAALSSYATGRQTSLVVDMGHEGTVGAPATSPPARALTKLGDVCLHKCAVSQYSHRTTRGIPPQHMTDLSNSTSRPKSISIRSRPAGPLCLRSKASLLQASAAGSATSAGFPRSS